MATNSFEFQVKYCGFPVSATNCLNFANLINPVCRENVTLFKAVIFSGRSPAGNFSTRDDKLCVVNFNFLVINSSLLSLDGWAWGGSRNTPLVIASAYRF